MEYQIDAHDSADFVDISNQLIQLGAIDYDTYIAQVSETNRIEDARVAAIKQAAANAAAQAAADDGEDNSAWGGFKRGFMAPINLFSSFF